MTGIRNFLKTYQAAHKTRAAWYHLQWRIFAVLVSAAAIFLVNNYLTWKFPLYIPELGAFLGERFFYWFMIGALFGIVMAAAVFEGEFILGVRRVAKELEAEAKQEFKRKPPTGRKRR